MTNHGTGMKLTDKDVEVLRAASSGRRDTFLPWRGSFKRSADLAKAGMLKDAGMSMMPPYTLYSITPLGLTVLAQIEGTKE